MRDFEFVLDDVITDTSRCRRCGRPLENKLSRERGLGPVCYEKIHAKLYPEMSGYIDSAMEDLGITMYHDGSLQERLLTLPEGEDG